MFLRAELFHSEPNLYIYIYIVMCWMVCVTKITGSSSDDWIYWHFGYSLS
jgi:hypothetical protein